MHIHAAIFVYILTAETAPEAVRLVRQTQLKRVCVKVVKTVYQIR